MSRASVKKLTIYVGLILLGMLISATVLSSSATGTPAVSQGSSAASMAQDQREPASTAASVWSTCTPLNVAAFSSRVHVKCAESVGGIQWFAASTANPAHAARVLSVLSTAHVAGRTLDILYDPDDVSGSAIGCAASDCRLIIAAAILQ